MVDWKWVPMPFTPDEQKIADQVNKQIEERQKSTSLSSPKQSKNIETKQHIEDQLEIIEKMMKKRINRRSRRPQDTAMKMLARTVQDIATVESMTRINSNDRETEREVACPRLYELFRFLETDEDEGPHPDEKIAWRNYIKEIMLSRKKYRKNNQLPPVEYTFPQHQQDASFLQYLVNIWYKIDAHKKPQAIDPPYKEDPDNLDNITQLIQSDKRHSKQQQQRLLFQLDQKRKRKQQNEMKRHEVNR